MLRNGTWRQVHHRLQICPPRGWWGRLSLMGRDHFLPWKDFSLCALLVHGLSSLVPPSANPDSSSLFCQVNICPIGSRLGPSTLLSPKPNPSSQRNFFLLRQLYPISPVSHSCVLTPLRYTVFAVHGKSWTFFFSQTSGMCTNLPRGTGSPGCPSGYGRRGWHVSPCLRWPFYKNRPQTALPPLPGGQNAVIVHDGTEGLSTKM